MVRIDHVKWSTTRGTRASGSPTPITVADWNERDNIVNLFGIVAGIMFEVIRVEPKETS